MPKNLPFINQHNFFQLQLSKNNQASMNIGRHKIQKKSTKNLPIQSKLTKISSTLSNDKELANLQSALQQSRIGIIVQQNLTNFNRDEYSEQFNDLREQLQETVVQISIEQKKNKVFEQLILLLKDNLKGIYQEKAQKIQKKQGEINKKIKELKMYIDRISKQRNQQVANIRVLKEHANAARGERVIYSNLFKKMEKQIKQNQEIYKQQILKMQKIRQQFEYTKKFGHLKDNLRKVHGNNKQSYTEESNHKKSDSIFDEEQSFQNINDNYEGLIIRKQMDSHTTKFTSRCKGKNYTKQKKSSEQNSGHEASGRQKLQNIKDHIDKYQGLCERVKTMAGYCNINEIFERFQGLSQKNSELFQNVEKLNEQIEQISSKIHKMRKQKQNKIFIEEDNGSSTPISGQQINKQASNSIQNNIHIIHSICSLFNINSNRKASEISSIPPQNELDRIEEYGQTIDNFIENGWNNGEKLYNTQQIEVPQKNIDDIDCVFNRMQSFDVCQRLLDRDAFRSEYKKQITYRKNKTRKN